jgi:hypothetical protein
MDTLTARQRYDEWVHLKKQTQGLYKQISSLNTEFEHLSNQATAKAVEYCLEAGLLQKISWKFEDHYGGHVLKAEVGSKELRELFETDYHCQTSITFDAKVHFDDGELSLRFKDMQALEDFALKHGLKVSFNSLKKERTRLELDIRNSQDQLKAVEKFLERFKKLQASGKPQ